MILTEVMHGHSIWDKFSLYLILLRNLISKRLDKPRCHHLIELFKYKLNYQLLCLDYLSLSIIKSGGTIFHWLAFFIYRIDS